MSPSLTDLSSTLGLHTLSMPRLAEVTRAPYASGGIVAPWMHTGATIIASQPVTRITIIQANDGSTCHFCSKNLTRLPSQDGLELRIDELNLHSPSSPHISHFFRVAIATSRVSTLAKFFGNFRGLFGCRNPRK